MDIINEIKASFKDGSILTRLIYINLAVFLILKIIYVFFFLFFGHIDFGMSMDYYFNNFIVGKYLGVKSNGIDVLIYFYTIITYMFTHFDFFHILFNMLYLYWFGQIFLSYFTQKQLLSNYIVGGVVGAMFFIFAYNLFPVFNNINAFAIGASASVMAIIFAISVYVPNHTISLMFIGDVKLKYIAMFSILLDIIQLPTGNAGGHIAHLGGAFWGVMFALQYKKGKDISISSSKIISAFLNMFKSKPKMKVSYKKTKDMSDMEYNVKKAEKQHETDKILEKISKSGYNSLSAKEKEMLFNQSNK